MARESPQAPLGCSPSASPASSGSMWESRQVQMRSPFPPWSPYAGTFVGAADPAFAALPSAEHVPDHPWNRSVVPTTGAHGANAYRENFLSLPETRNLTPEMFEDIPAACDYLTGVGAAAVGNVAGPAAYVPASVDRYATATVPPVKHEMASSPLAYSGDSVLHGGSMGCVSCYDHEVKRGNQQDFGARCSSIGTERLMEFSFGMGSLAGAGSFGDFASMAKFVSSSRQELDITAEMGSSNSGAASVTKKRYTEERVGVNVKKSKQKSPTTSSPPKPEAPRVKLGDKITALQQIVSPFGKTDTASVLFETIKYIKFLHEQIQLFSEPYMTKNTYKGHIQFGAEEKGMTRTERDLRGRGLCLVPVSWTSQAYPDDTLPDCWTPAYRSCLYR